MREYLENQPSRRHQRWAEQFWTFEAPTSDTAIILPDARSDLILKFHKNDEHISDIVPIVSLPMTSPYHVEYEKGDCWIGVRLKPEQTCAIKHFSTEPQIGETVAPAIADKVFALALSSNSLETIADLRLALGVTLEALPVVAFPNWVRGAIDRFHLSGGRVDIANMARVFGVSDRHFRREFSNAVHVSPKAYCSVIKFHRALRLIMHRGLSVSDVAFEVGYADHPHLIRAFKKLGGFSPSSIPAKLSLPGLPIN